MLLYPLTLPGTFLLSIKYSFGCELEGPGAPILGRLSSCIGDNSLGGTGGIVTDSAPLACLAAWRAECLRLGCSLSVEVAKHSSTSMSPMGGFQNLI